MAFVTTTTPSTLRWNPRRKLLSTRTTPRCTAATSPASPASQPNTPMRRYSPSKPRKRTSAHVVDSRVASRIETHHWIVVKSKSMRMFERAAVAQADAARQVDARTHTGALHRWVLRHVEDPAHIYIQQVLPPDAPSYVVMEAFNKHAPETHNQFVTRRWLSAVERAGPLMDALHIQTLQYENVFTSKLHDVTFDPHQNIVVMESINIDTTNKAAPQTVVDSLRQNAEKSVANGACLEFCVLHAPNDHGFYKTIEIYQNVEALKSHMNATDRAITKEIAPYVIQGSRNRQTFKPVVFA